MKVAFYNVNVKLCSSRPILHLAINNFAMHNPFIWAIYSSKKLSDVSLEKEEEKPVNRAIKCRREATYKGRMARSVI